MVESNSMILTDHLMTYDEVMKFLDVSKETLDDLIKTNTVYPILLPRSTDIYFSEWAIKLFKDTITWKEWK